jgi:hypothetical protein
MPCLDLVQQPRIQNLVLTIFGTICDQTHALAPFSSNARVNAIEGFRFDITGGVSGREIRNSLIQPAISIGCASVRVCLSDRELL